MAEDIRDSDASSKHVIKSTFLEFSMGHVEMGDSHLLPC